MASLESMATTLAAEVPGSAPVYLVDHDGGRVNLYAAREDPRPTVILQQRVNAPEPEPESVTEYRPGPSPANVRVTSAGSLMVCKVRPTDECPQGVVVCIMCEDQTSSWLQNARSPVNSLLFGYEDSSDPELNECARRQGWHPDCNRPQLSLFGV